MISDRPFHRPQGASQNIQDLYPDAVDLARGDHPFGAPHVRRFVTMLIEPPVYLNAMLRDFLLAGGTLVVRGFDDLRAVAALPEPVVVNCTGLGAKALFGDAELMPIKGQLTILLPQPEVEYITLRDDLYMFPRRDGILLGGTARTGRLDARAQSRCGAARPRRACAVFRTDEMMRNVLAILRQIVEMWYRVPPPC